MTAEIKSATRPVRAPLPTALRPRAVRLPAAAAYLSVSTSTFQKWVALGIMPEPTRIHGCVLWDVWRLDDAYDALSNACDENNAWDATLQ